ncbi:MAG TPA: HTH domain-containing protein [Mycobacteriales bacterium]|nr:HTH domain-containing protein [Mycobacteriales bacterium]
MKTLPRATRARDVADGRTRDQVARLLLERGPSTAAALSAELGLSAAAVRRHLDGMLAAGTITSREARVYGRRGRGRPARLFMLTDAGHAAGPLSYDDLAVHALRHLAETGGPDAVRSFAEKRVRDAEARYAERIAAAPDATPAGRASALASALSVDGYAAGVQDVASGLQLCQHHCPVQRVAAEFPQLCEAETAAFSRLLGTHVQRLATIAHGDGVCTTHIPNPTPAPAPGKASR